MTTRYTNDQGQGYVASDGLVGPLLPGNLPDSPLASVNAPVDLPQGFTSNQAVLTNLTNTTGVTLTAASLTAGDIFTQVNMTGTLGAAANLQFPTAAALIAALFAGGPVHVGDSWRVRIANLSSANFAWTTTTNTGLTLVGTQSIPQNYARDYNLSVTGAASVTITSVGATPITA